MSRRQKVLALLAVSLFALAACARQPMDVDTAGAPGFFWGLLHGWISFFALIGHIFNHDIRVYAYPNSGGWYDLGFLIGVGMIGGGTASTSR